LEVAYLLAAKHNKIVENYFSLAILGYKKKLVDSEGLRFALTHLPTSERESEMKKIIEGILSAEIAASKPKAVAAEAPSVLLSVRKAPPSILIVDDDVVTKHDDTNLHMLADIASFRARKPKPMEVPYDFIGIGDTTPREQEARMKAFVRNEEPSATEIIDNAHFVVFLARKSAEDVGSDRLKAPARAVMLKIEEIPWEYVWYSVRNMLFYWDKARLTHQELVNVAQTILDIMDVLVFSKASISPPIPFVKDLGSIRTYLNRVIDTIIKKDPSVESPRHEPLQFRHIFRK